MEEWILTYYYDSLDKRETFYFACAKEAFDAGKATALTPFLDSPEPFVINGTRRWSFDEDTGRARIAPRVSGSSLTRTRRHRP